jgi:hypothetical protein
MAYARLTLLLFAAAILASCDGTDPDTGFSGTYAAVTGHSVRPLIRIFRANDHYLIARTVNGSWTDTGEPMQPVTREVFEQYVGHPVQGNVSGLTYESATLMRLPVGFTEGKFVSHTGYLLITAAGPVEVQKQ